VTRRFTAADPLSWTRRTEAARRAREPLGPAIRKAPERPGDVDDVDAVKRLIDPDPPAPTAATLNISP